MRWNLKLGLLVIIAVLLIGTVAVAATDADGQVWTDMVEFCKLMMSNPELHANMHNPGSPTFQEMIRSCHGDEALNPQI